MSVDNFVLPLVVSVSDCPSEEFIAAECEGFAIILPAAQPMHGLSDLLPERSAGRTLCSALLDHANEAPADIRDASHPAPIYARPVRS